MGRDLRRETWSHRKTFPLKIKAFIHVDVGSVEQVTKMISHGVGRHAGCDQQGLQRSRRQNIAVDDRSNESRGKTRATRENGAGYAAKIKPSEWQVPPKYSLIRTCLRYPQSATRYKAGTTMACAAPVLAIIASRSMPDLLHILIYASIACLCSLPFHALSQSRKDIR